MSSFTVTEEAATKPTNGAARPKIDKLMSDVEEVPGRTAGAVDLDIGKLRDSLTHKLAAARDGIVEGGQRIGEAAISAARTTDAYVHRSPWQAIGIAAAAGVAIGYMLARRSGPDA